MSGTSGRAETPEIGSPGTASAATTAQVGRLSHEEAIARAEQLLPGLRERARLAEELRRVPEETMKEVEQADLLRIMVPSRYGGHGLGLPTVCAVTRVLARACPSTAWVVGFLIEHNWQLARFPGDVQDEIFGSQPYVRAPAQLQPAGVLRPVEGGYRVSGRWEFCSAVLHADWVILAGVVSGDEQPTGDRRGAKVFVAPIDDVTVLDDWHTSGMRATGSNTVVTEDLFVAEHRVTGFGAFAGEDNLGGQIHAESVVRYPLGPSLTVFAASVALGAAEATVELFKEQLGRRVLFATAGEKPVDRPRSQARLADAAVALRTAQLLWQDALDLLCTTNDGGGRLTVAERAWVRLAAARSVVAARDAIATVCDGAGAHIYYETSPIQRFQRDVETLKGHVVFDVDRAGVLYGRVALGLEPNDML